MSVVKKNDRYFTGTRTKLCVREQTLSESIMFAITKDVPHMETGLKELCAASIKLDIKFLCIIIVMTYYLT